MAQFTLEVKDVMENVFGTTMEASDYEVEYAEMSFENSVFGRLPVIPDPELLGLGTYPIFDENYRKILNGKIIDEYFNREIGLETIDMWRLAVRRRMDQIMPYYNKMYETERLDYNALETMRIHSVSTRHEEGEEVAEAKNISTSETDSKGRAVTSQTPQTMLAQNADYATGASDSQSESDVASESNQDSSSSNSTDFNSDNLVTGFQGVASELVNRYRASLLNIDVSIIRELEDCFMMILNNGDSYTPTNGWIY